MKALLATVLVLGSLSAYAELPPLASSLRRINAILESEVVRDSLDPMAQVSGVVQVDGSDVYEVTTSDCVLKVRVVAVQGDPVLIGPAKLEVQRVDLTCLAR